MQAVRGTASRRVKSAARSGVVAVASSFQVELEGVTKIYPPAVRALRGVGGRFEGGKVSVVLGANGSGKSTLLASVGTLARATSGKVSHGSLGKSREAVRRRLGWVGHDALCYADLTGRENIELAARLHNLPVD